MQWSYDQLSDPEQSLLRKLSVFKGGWSLDAATAVWEEDADEFEVLDLLTQLADKSLVVVREVENEPRFGYLETVREYAAEQFKETGDVEGVRSRHLDFYLEFADRAVSSLVGPEQTTWTSRLDRDHGNLLTAISWARSQPSLATRGLALAGVLARYWSMRGLYELGQGVLAGALDHEGPSVSSPERAMALVRMGGMALYRGDLEGARIPIEDSLAIYREIGDAKGVTRALSGLATVATYQGDFALARRYNEDVLVELESRGETRAQAVTLHNLGFLLLCQDLPSEAITYYERALAMLREIMDLKHIALTLADLATATLRSGDLAAAISQLQVGLNLGLGDEPSRENAYLMECGSEIAASQGSLELAVRWHGVAARVRDDLGASLAPAELSQREALMQTALDDLGPEAFGTALAEGRETNVQEALAAIRSWLIGRGHTDAEAPVEG